jgi:non-ribosomal peptide synthetase component F
VLPIRIAVGSGETLATLRQKIRAQILEVMRHGPYAPPNRPQRNAYDVVLNYHPYSFARLNGAPAVPEWIHTGHGSESLTLQIRDFASAGSIVLDFDFHCDVFDADECARAIGHVVSVVDAVLEAPDQPLERIGLLTPAERHRILAEWNATEASCPPAAGIHRLFEAQVARQPDAITSPT